MPSRHRSRASAGNAHAGLAWPRPSRRGLASHVRRWAWLALLASVGLLETSNAESPDRWRPYPNVGLLDGVTLRIHWFETTKELRAAAKSSEQGVKEIGLNGFSILKRNTSTGEYVCDVYVVKMTGASIDGDHTTTFGHEVLHCFGLQHE